MYISKTIQYSGKTNQMLVRILFNLFIIILIGIMQSSWAQDTEVLFNDAQGTSLSGQAIPVPTPVIKKIVVLDPGHGGKNSGVVFKNRLPEKQLSLQLALQIKKNLKRYDNINVFMTRNSDMDLPVIERVMKCNRKNADVFISIHSRGIVQTSKNHDKTNVYINKFVNDTYLSNVVKNNMNKGIKVIPWDLAQNRYIEKSRRLAENLIQNLDESINKESTPKELPLAVLRGVRSAAVLIEVPNVMLINNEDKQKQYIEEMTKQITDGIVQFLY